MKKFLTTRMGRKIALGLFAFFCFLMSSTSASAQTWVSEATAIANLTQKCQTLKSELGNPPSDPKAEAMLVSRYNYKSSLLTSISGGTAVQTAYNTVQSLVLNHDVTSPNVALDAADAKTANQTLQQEAFALLTI